MRIERIVVGIDFGEASRAAAAWTACFAPTSELLLVHAVELPTPSPFAPELVPEAEERAPAVVEERRLQLTEEARALGAAHVSVVARVGRPHVVLVGEAEDRGAGLIVVGPHDGDGIRRWSPLGTTADRLVRTAPVPVVIATNAPAAPPRRVLAAIDGSSITRRVLHWAHDVVETFDGRARVVTAWNPGIGTRLVAAAIATARDDVGIEAEATSDERSDDALTWVETMAHAAIGRERADAIVVSGKPGDAILEAAEEFGAELIVIGRSGTGEIASALLGSTVRTVLHGARCPVLVVTD